MSKRKEIEELLLDMSSDEERQQYSEKKIIHLVDRFNTLHESVKATFEERDREYGEALELLIKETDKQVKSYLREAKLEINEKISSLNDLIDNLDSKANSSEFSIKEEIKNAKTEIKQFSREILETHNESKKNTLELISSWSDKIKESQKEFDQKIGEKTKEFSKGISDLRLEMLSHRGGGSIPLQVSAGGTVANTRFAEINFVSATASTNNTTKRTDITIGGFTTTPLTLVAGQVAYTGITVLPKYVATDSSILKDGFGYALTGSVGNYTVTFDITPQSWADIIS